MKASPNPPWSARCGCCLPKAAGCRISGTRMDDIALRAGVSKGGLYAHFASKEAIFEALLERHLAPAPLDIPAIVDSADSVQALAER
ncbi:hypothetical protein CTI14_50165, partial [Methylobacterium radiotolerans]